MCEVYLKFKNYNLGSRGDQGIKGDFGLMGMPGRVGEQGPPVNKYNIIICPYFIIKCFII